MIRRFIWFAALAATALLTAMLQIDMRARSMPALAAIVPAALRDEAQASITRQALLGNDAARALAEAKTLVVRRPLPAENLTMLAAAQAKAGQDEAALRTIQVAGRRGWREPASQEAMLRLALAAGDRPEAARRYAALFLNGRTPDRLLLALGPAVLGGPDPAARDTLVAVVVGGERWHATFLRRGVQVMPPAAFAGIAAGSIARGARFDCGALKLTLNGLAQRDPGAEATLRAAAFKRCPQIGE